MSNWETVQSGSVKPEAVDTTSSKKFNYVRKNFTSSPVLDSDGNETGEVQWSYLEKKVLKEDWEFHQSIIENTNAIEEQAESLNELQLLVTDQDLTIMEQSNTIDELESMVTDQDLTIIDQSNTISELQTMVTDMDLSILELQNQMLTQE